MSPRSWLAVASADHVASGRRQGILQIGHGRAEPLRRLKAGDRIACYSPVLVSGGHTPYQAFTALGIVTGKIFQIEMAPGFHPYRRTVSWADTQPVSIRQLLGQLELTQGQRNWGFAFRSGLVAVTEADMDTIAAALQPTAHGSAEDMAAA